MARFPKIFILLLLSMLTTNGWATVTSVTASPTLKNVPTNRSVSVSINWRVADNTSVAGSVTVSSSFGVFLANSPSCGAVPFCVNVGTVNKPLSKTYTSPGGTFLKTLFFNEGIQVPLSTIQRVRKLGLTSFIFRRSFVSTEGSGVSVSEDITLRITGGGAASFGISREALRFTDGTIFKIVDIKTPLKVLSEVDFQGAGLLQATWEVATPASSAGTPIYIPLRTVRKYLAIGPKQIFTSPRLPTYLTGQYRVRLRITDPLPGFTAPVIRYFVGQPGIGQIPPQPMVLGGPTSRSWIDETTRFAWRPVKRAGNYRLELYAKPSMRLADSLPSLGGGQDTRTPVRLTGKPVTGMVVPGDQAQTVLSPSVRRRLTGGQWYYWRVLAFDDQGRLIGISPVREVRAP